MAFNVALHAINPEAVSSMNPTPEVPSGASITDATSLVGNILADGTASLRAKVDGEPEQQESLERNCNASILSTDSVRGEFDGLVPEEAVVEETNSPTSHLFENMRTFAGDYSRQNVKKTRRKGIPIKLEKTDQAGCYLLTAEDATLRDVLRQGFEHSKEGNIKKKRSRFSDLVFTKQFTAFDRQNAASASSVFHGFFSLFWMGIALMLIKVAANNWRVFGSIFGHNEIVELMLSRDLVILGLTDGVMCGITIVSLLVQKLVAKDYISWSRFGWILQNVWQAIFLASFIAWPRYRQWPWTHSVFITLHTITMLMKQHSYAFYNGYLSQLLGKRRILEQKLAQLDDPDLKSSTSSPDTAALATSYFDARDLSQLSRRRKSISATGFGEAAEVDQDITSVAVAIESDAPLTWSHVKSLRKLISWEIESINEELKGTCNTTKNHYPRNLNVRDFYSYIPLPTVVYELEYPRQEKINWGYVAEKTGATFGVIGVMIVVSTAYIYPVVLSIAKMKEDGLPLSDRLKQFPWAFSDLLFPFMMEYLLSWYVIWECVLNVLAELTLFADRGFYADWWNSTSWDQFARDWNRPVHNFLLRFAYHSSISTFRLSRSSATLVTFLLSACVHELLMAVIFGKIRGYLLAAQMLQLPMVMLSRTRFLKGKDVLGNLVFWLGIFVGPSFLCSLYLFL